MPSTWGHFVFFLIALKQLRAASVSPNTTSAAAHCCFRKLIPQPCKIWNAERNIASGPYWCICRRCWASFSSFPVYSITTASFVTYIRKPQNSTFLSARRCSPEHLCSWKKKNRERRFRLLGHIPQILVDDGALFPFFLSGQETTSVLKKQEEIRRILRSGPLLFPGTHSKAVSIKKKTLKKDYSLWVILLIMLSTWGHFVLFLFAPKQLYAALVVSNTTPAANHCGPSQLILLVGHIHAFAVDAGPVFRLSRYTPSQQKASLLTSPQKRKNFHICFTATEGSPGETFRSCKTI